MAIAFILTAGAPSLAADTSGVFWMGGGVGATTCPVFVRVMDSVKGASNLEYVKNTQGFTMFLSGFQTAYNSQTAVTCDIFHRVNFDQALAWVDNFCRQNPLSNFGSAVVALGDELHPRRSMVCEKIR